MRTGRQDWRFGIGLVLGLLGLALIGSGCVSGGGVRPPIDPPPAPVVTFAVYAYNPETGAPVADARVDVQWTATEDDGRTNADGYWSVLAPAYTAFIVQLHADGYDIAEQRIDALSDNFQAAIALQPSTPSTPHALVGRLRIDGGCYRDDTGCVLPLYAHAGNLFSLYTRDPERARAELDAIARSGYHGLRTWSTLGGDWWAGKHVGDYTTPDYPGQVRAFFADVAARKLRLVWSQGDIGWMRDRRATMALFAQIDTEVGGVIDFIDCGNEAYTTGGGGPERMAECVGYYQQAGGRALKTLTDAPIYWNPGREKETFDDYSRPPADAWDVHSYRGGHSYDKRRHAWGYGYENPPRLPLGISSEPPGSGALVSVTENKHELDDEALGLLAAGSFLGRQAFVWFSGEGVILDRGLHVENGFASVPRAVALLPRDLMTYRIAHHSGSSWRGTRVLAAPNDEVRVDGRMSDSGDFAYTIDGPAGTWRFAVERDFVGRVCDPGPATCEDVSRRAGESITLSFTRGRLFMGRIGGPSGLADMGPRLPLDDGDDVAVGDAELASQIVNVGESSTVTRANLDHLVGGELASTHALTTDESVLPDRVVDVVGRSAEEQVIRPYAGSYVAFVADHHALRYASVIGQLPTHDVGVRGAALSPATADASVAGSIVATPDPNPAGVGLLNLLPEPFLECFASEAGPELPSIGRLSNSHVTSSGSVVRGAAVFEHRSRSAYFSPPFAVSGEALRSPVQ